MIMPNRNVTVLKPQFCIIMIIIIMMMMMMMIMMIIIAINMALFL